MLGPALDVHLYCFTALKAKLHFRSQDQVDPTKNAIRERMKSQNHSKRTKKQIESKGHKY